MTREWALDEDMLMYYSDYPHADRNQGTARLLEQRDDLAASAKRKILEDNARRFYGI